MELSTALPNHEQVLAVTHAQLAHVILRGLLEEKRNDLRLPFAQAANPQVLLHLQEIHLRGYRQDVQSQVELAVREAWGWMTRELILLESDQLNPGWRCLSRIGQAFVQEVDPARLLAYRQIDTESIHPTLRGDALENFWRGSYDVAVFCAFRDVEVAVRRAGGFPDTRIGVQLMTEAFNPTGGPLSDPQIPPAEQEAMMQLFRGAYGLFRNPNGHRYVQVTPQSAVELLVLASHLLKLVDARQQPTP